METFLTLFTLFTLGEEFTTEASELSEVPGVLLERLDSSSLVASGDKVWNGVIGFGKDGGAAHGGVEM